MKYLVTGGHGFIGRHLVAKLLGEGHEVVVVDLEGDFPPKFEYEFVYANIAGGNYNHKIMEAMDGVDTVFHLAAKARVQPSIEHPVEFNQTNVEGTLALLEMCRHQNVRRFVFSSSSSIYGDTETFPTPETAPKKPLSPYGLQKLIGEQYCELYSTIHGLETVSLRYFNVYGDRMNNEGYKLVFPIFKEQILNNKPLTINNNGEQRRDFIHVNDVVRANILVAKHSNNFNGDIYNVGNGKNYSINEIADMFGGEKQYGNQVIEPFETLAETAKIDLDLNFQPKKDLKQWISTYTEQN